MIHNAGWSCSNAWIDQFFAFCPDDAYAVAVQARRSTMQGGDVPMLELLQASRFRLVYVIIKDYCHLTETCK